MNREVIVNLIGLVMFLVGIGWLFFMVCIFVISGFQLESVTLVWYALGMSLIGAVLFSGGLRNFLGFVLDGFRWFKPKKPLKVKEVLLKDTAWDACLKEGFDVAIMETSYVPIVQSGFSLSPFKKESWIFLTSADKVQVIFDTMDDKHVKWVLDNPLDAVVCFRAEDDKREVIAWLEYIFGKVKLESKYNVKNPR